MRDARPPTTSESRLETAIYASAKKLRALVVEQGMWGRPIPDVADRVDNVWNSPNATSTAAIRNVWSASRAVGREADNDRLRRADLTIAKTAKVVNKMQSEQSRPHFGH